MKPVQLTIQQQFQLELYRRKLGYIESLEQAQEMVLQLLRQQMIKDNIIKDLLKHE